MKRAFVLLLIITIAIFQLVFRQKIGTCIFTRISQSVDYNLKSSKSTFSEGISTGIGATQKPDSWNWEYLFVLEGVSYDYYSFFNLTINSINLSSSVKFGIDWLDKIRVCFIDQNNSTSYGPSQVEFAFFPISNSEFNKEIPLCMGIACQGDESLFTIDTLFEE
ncbi:MAG: hypothetical protein AAF600_21745 [Bacteroidota bacterium]